MKQLIIFLSCFLSFSIATAQAPQQVNYQAIARSSGGALLVNKNISVRFTIKQGSATGSSLYTEVHQPTTNQYGLFNLTIGTGTSSGNFAGINWGNGTKYLQVEIDPAGGTSFTDLGTTQFVSVPYAIYSNNAAVSEYATIADSAIIAKKADTALYALAGGSGGSGGSGWQLTGNSGTTASNFLGTTDNSPLRIRVNNAHIAKLDANNINIGILTGISATTGVGNIAIGRGTLATYTDAYQNVAIGDSVLSKTVSGFSNVAAGYQAMYNNASGYHNLALGVRPLYQNTTGYSNVALGYGTMLKNTTGYVNTAIGALALSENKIGQFNTAVGGEALMNTTSNYNTAIGYTALRDNTSGQDNVAAGNRAMYYSISGSGNTALGAYALEGNNSGSNNTAVGYNAFKTGSGFVNSTAIGFNASVSASNQVILGNSSVSSIQGQVSFSTFSDARVKNNVTADVPGLGFIRSLRPVTYNYDVDKENELLGLPETGNQERKYDIENIKFSGFIAQEVEQAAIKNNYNFSGIDKSGNLLSLRYSDFVPSIVKAVQEQQEIIDAQQKQIEELLQRINQLEQKK